VPSSRGKMAADDELFVLKNLFHLGCYQQAISESISAHPSNPESAIEAKFFMYRAYIEQGQYRLVLDEVRQDAPPALLAVKTLAAYLSGNQEVAVSQIKELLAQAAGNWQVLLVAASIFCQEKDYKSALQHSHQNTQLDVMALVTHIYLALHRTELAKKHLAAMQAQDDDATLTKLAAGWVAMHEGGEKYQDALYEFQELGEKYSMSLMLLNSMAVCQMQMGKFRDAEELLQQAQSKSSNDVNTMANMAVCAQHLEKAPEVINRYVNQLKDAAPKHPWAERHDELTASFDRCAAQFGKA
jgi:coatomer protein complex subunit epsilon